MLTAIIYSNHRYDYMRIISIYIYLKKRVSSSDLSGRRTDTIRRMNKRIGYWDPEGLHRKYDKKVLEKAPQFIIALFLLAHIRRDLFFALRDKAGFLESDETKNELLEIVESFTFIKYCAK